MDDKHKNKRSGETQKPEQGAKTKIDASEFPAYKFVPGTPEERIAMVWPLTVEFCSQSDKYDADQPLQRHITRLIRLEDYENADPPNE